MSGPVTALLVPHPASSGAAAQALHVECSATVAGLALRYRFSGDPATLRLPAAQPPGPADGLSQSTCCEAFVASPAGSDYREFNFSPSGQWAAYRFTNYRQRDVAFAPAELPPLAFRRLADGFELQATLPAALLPAAGPLLLGLSAVIEGADGDKDYWALAHAGERPDFHCRQTFTLVLNRP